MKLSRTSAILPLALAGSLALVGCGSNNNTGANSASSGGAGAGTTSGATMATGSGAGENITCATGKLSGAGSTFQDPMEQKWISEYTSKCSGAQINYQAVGSGQGIQTFGAGQVDFAGSDVTMKSDEQAAADKRCGGNKAVHIPIVAGGVAVTWNLPNVKSLKFSPDTLAKIFSGRIKNWNDPAIKADNGGANLPNLPITVIYRSDASGTNSVFTGYLAATSPGVWTLGSGKTINWPTGQGAAKNQGVSAAVAQTPGAITYTEQAFAQQHNLPTGQIRNGAGQYVSLSSSTVSQALTSLKITPNSASDLSATIDYAPRQGYPISTVTYVIVCSKYPSSFSGTRLLKDYLTYITTAGQQDAEGLGFAPLPAGLAAKVASSISSIS